MPRKTYDPTDDEVLKKRRAKKSAFFSNHVMLGNALKEVLPNIPDRAILRIYQSYKADEIEGFKATQARGDLYVDPDKMEDWVNTPEAASLIHVRRGNCKA